LFDRSFFFLLFAKWLPEVGAVAPGRR